MSANEKILKLTENDARTALFDYKKRSGKSQGAIGRELGFTNGSAVSQFLSGTYETPHTMIEKIQRLLQISDMQEVSPKRPGFCMTSISQQVTNLIKLCHVQGELGVAYGDPGVGKTMAVRNYANEHPDAVIITVSPTNATITGVNELIADKLKVKEKLSRRITAEIIAKLKGSKRVIIVDETLPFFSPRLTLLAVNPGGFFYQT